jgi:signal transduction histidine kinase
VRIDLKLLRTSTFRLAAVYLVLFAVSVSAVLAYVYWNTAVLIERQSDDTIAAEVRGIAEQYQQRGIAGVIDTVASRSQESAGAVYIFTNALGRRMAGNLPSLPVEAVGEHGWIEFSFPLETSRGLDRHTARAFYTELEDGYRLVIGRDVEERRQLASIIRTSLVWALGLSLVLGIGSAVVVSRNFLRRIDAITGASRTIMAGNLSGRMPVSGTGDELDRLAASLNEMLNQIERLMSGMKEISSNIAHDLRSPLTRVRSRVENALASGRKADYQVALREGLDDIDRLLTTFNALLSIARAEAGQTSEGLKPVDAATIVSDVAELYGPTIEEAKGSLDVELAQGISIRADRQLLAQAIANLMDNAIKYGSDPTAARGPLISLRLTTSGRDAVIMVADQGSGIPAAQREHAKERFVRLDESRTQPGNGLGLSLVVGIMKLHCGRLDLDDNRPGLVARLVLPRLERTA